MSQTKEEDQRLRAAKTEERVQKVKDAHPGITDQRARELVGVFEERAYAWMDAILESAFPEEEEEKGDSGSAQTCSCSNCEKHRAQCAGREKKK